MEDVYAGIRGMDPEQINKSGYSYVDARVVKKFMSRLAHTQTDTHTHITACELHALHP